MKKLCCILMAIAMLCSLMVVNASAAYTYEGEMFEITSDYEMFFDDVNEPYLYFCWVEDLDFEIEISIDEMDYKNDPITDAFPEVDSCEEYYESYKEYYEDEEEILIDGVPAFVDLWDDDACCFIRFWSDNYSFVITLAAADTESLEILYELFVDGFEITDSTSWYEADDADTNKDDKTDKNTDEKDDDENSNSDNTTIIIVAIVVAGVVVIAVAAIVVLGKKKK